jgi:AcrR family transcriptional regulator
MKRIVQGEYHMDIQTHEMPAVNMEEMSVRERIIAATLGLIEKEGVHGLTTRTIAREANVNIAAINYYFSSKQKLIEETLQAALNHMFSDTDEFFAQMGNSGEGILRNMMMYMLQGAVRYPGLIKAMLNGPINNNDYSDPVVQRILKFTNDLISKAEQVMQQDRAAVSERLMQIFSVALMTALLPDMFKMVLGEDFAVNIDKQKEYIQKFFDPAL